MNARENNNVIFFTRVMNARENKSRLARIFLHRVKFFFKYVPGYSTQIGKKLTLKTSEKNRGKRKNSKLWR